MKKILVVGGAGFIGLHVTKRYLSEAYEVHVIDNLSRNGARANYNSLRELAPEMPGKLHFSHVDIRIANDVTAAIGSIQPDLLVHEAAQVAVTTSVQNPRLDFEVNALGTFNILEAIRLYSPDTFVVYASTNKVYGGMEEVEVLEEEKRYKYRDFPEGLDENCNLDFHSPYACSKGIADQYVHDYSRIYGLRTTVFRQSCIYGTHQYGVEDQGWIAWFTIARVLNRPVTIYGTGKQVRDVLWAEDLVEAYNSAWEKDKKGAIYNMGGGAENSLSLMELVETLDQLHPTNIELKYDEERPGDQPVYIANINLAKQELDWSPKVNPVTGIKRLYEWIVDNRETVIEVLGD